MGSVRAEGERWDGCAAAYRCNETARVYGSIRMPNVALDRFVAAPENQGDAHMRAIGTHADLPRRFAIQGPWRAW